MADLAGFRRRAARIGFAQGRIYGEHPTAMRALAKSRLPIERNAIVTAIRGSRGNITDAARALGASRRTLQNRMRDYGIPEGQSGRPRNVLSYEGRFLGIRTSDLVVGAILGVGGFLLVRWWLQKRAEERAREAMKRNVETAP